MGIKRSITSLIVLIVGVIVWEGLGDKQVYAIEYDETVNVRLIPSQTFTVTPSGSYRLVNLDTGRLVNYSGTIEFRYSSTGRVGIRLSSSDSLKYSAQGFRLEEETAEYGQDLSITSVQVAGAHRFTTNRYRGSLEVRPALEGESRLRVHNLLDINDYLRGVVPREMSANWHLEALKAQSVAARNFAKSAMDTKPYLVDTIIDQVYVGKTGEHSRTNQAVDETSGEYVTHNGTIINAFYHSSSGGHTENSENVWVSNVPYIRGVEDSYDSHPNNPRHRWESSISASEMGAYLFGDGWTVTDIQVTDRSQAGRVQQLTISGAHGDTTAVKTVPEGSSSADSIRSALGLTLNSTLFDVRTDGQANMEVRVAGGGTENVGSLNGLEMVLADNETTILSGYNLPVRTSDGVEYVNHARKMDEAITFTGGGWGHGLGMSQWGALGMAEAGYTYGEILRHYYTDVQIEQRK
ncbi:stage II sporulation protein D [Geomicrobium halophilum]|uniref:Stage II sporulation protein D n=1 Tax=Geomicrobium halophilum TaxID=549000 RepID=A0A841Q039_9BACL|nr:SpoIID/LytB domain-containing protein [Geomicrobium halophilum]MBB6450395.1 stage II sporulation protein D [Geomicrobium halophilum]